MNFDLKRPCPKCPFRTDVTPYLRATRVRELERAIVGQQATFACHQTVDYSDDPDGDDSGPNVQHCAGALILLEKIGRPNQLMRWMERLTRKDGRPFYDAAALDMEAPVYRSFSTMYEAHKRGRKLTSGGR